MKISVSLVLFETQMMIHGVGKALDKSVLNFDVVVNHLGLTDIIIHRRSWRFSFSYTGLPHLLVVPLELSELLRRWLFTFAERSCWKCL